MKLFKIIIPFVLLSTSLYAQEFSSANRDISLLVINKKGVVLDRFFVQSVNDSASVVLPTYGEAIIPVKGMDSIVVTLLSKSSFSFINHSGKSITVKKKVNTSGSLSDVPALLQQKAYRSLIELLQARAGLNISQSGSTQLRGQTTLLSGDSEPLVVMDGIAIGTLGYANNIVNIYDIQSIEVLKDGAGWGTRGANGVILIKSKK